MPKNGHFVPDQQLVDKLDSLLEEHKGLTAWSVIEDLPPLATWEGLKERRLASQLAYALGNYRLSYYLDWKNWRQYPDDHRSFFRALFSRFRFKAGSLLLPEIEARLSMVEPGSEVYADLLGLIASCLGDVREFKQAHERIDEAMKECKDPSWLWVQRSLTYRREDRYEDALEAALEGRKVKPFYRPVVEAHATALINLGRDDEARDALIEASQQSDNPTFALRLSSFFSERDDVEQTSHWLEEFERRSPLIDDYDKKWLAGRKADLCYLSGDIEGFLNFAGQTKKKSFHQRCLKYYQEHKGQDGNRKRLEVNFVRQHNMTCAPATIAALTEYFQKPHDHLEIANAICYDGTPWHKERKWCEENQFVACEFPITMESTKALIDADIPFTLTTQSIDSGHLQACIGYDDKLGLLLLRDPTLRHYGEAILSGLQKDHPVFGLRGLAFVPLEQKERLESLNLPGQLAYDLYYELSCAFDDHDENRIHQVMDRFRSELPEAPLRYQSECRVAAEFGHPATELEFTEKLIELFPKHQTLWLRKIRILERLSRYTEARDFLLGIHRKPESDPFFDMEVGESLCRDVRNISLGQFYLRRALRQRPSSSQAHASYADSLNILGQREEALRFRRSATRLNRSFEPYAQRYHQEATYLRKESEALAYLRERADSVGELSVEPHLTLLRILGRKNDQQAPELAASLLERFPEDGDLLLETVTLFSGWNRHEEAIDHLERSRGKVAKQSWLRVAARYWSWTSNRTKSREHWEELIKISPLEVSAYESVARHLAEEQDRETANEYMREAHEAHPDYLPLLKSYIEWEEFNGPAASIPLLETAISLDPLDLWAIRELALELSKDEQFDLAEEKAKEALTYDPSDPISHGILGLVREAAQRKAEAAVSFREALKLDIDYTTAFDGLMRVDETYSARKDSLKFVREEMIRQVSNGDIVPEYRAHASGVVEPSELEKDLKLFQRERPDLWQTWNALAEHYHATSRHDLELETARKMTERFPLLPRAWAELGFALRSKGETEEEVRAFRKALDLSPGWDWILRELSSSLESLERFDEALEFLDRAIEAEPLASGGYGYKADLLWKIGRRSEAISEIKRALKVSPLYQWGWAQLIEWSKHEQLEDEVPALIAELEKKRAHQWSWWACLADVYGDLDKPEEALAAIEKALGSKPRKISLLDQKASLLTDLGRYSDAIQVCQTPFEDGKQPVRLQGREAWILMQSGHRKEAWNRMKTLSETEPDYYFAHNQLAYWSYNTDSWEHLKSASERMVALRPDDADGWGYLGQAEEELKNPDGALEAYSRGLRARPSYLFAARRKARLEFKADKLDAAEDTLKRIKHHHQSAFIIADQLAIALKQCQGQINQTVSDLWNDLSITSQKLDQDPYYYTDTIFKDAGLNGLYDILLSEAAKNGNFRSPAEARAWGRRIRESKKRKKLTTQVLRSDLENRFKASVVAELVRGVGEEVPKKEVEKLITTHSPLLEKHYDSWSAVLDYYSDEGNAEACCRYGDLWKNFVPQLHPDSLTAYATFVDDLRSFAAGQMAREAILKEFPQWEGTRYLRVCLAFQHALSGNIDASQTFLSGYEDERNPHKFYDAIYHHTLAIIASLEGDAAACESHFRTASDLIRSFSQNTIALKYLNSSAEACARNLNLFKGRPKKLLKKWAKGLGKKESEISWWWVVLIIWILIKIIQATSK